MANQIVQLSVSQTVAAAPSTLQQTGAFVSQGGTTNAVNSLTLITQASSLTAMLTPLSTNSTLSWAGGTVTVTTSVVHGLTTNQTYYLTIAGVSPTGYNGTYACTITGNTTFTYALASNPGAETAPGTWSSSTRNQLQQMTNTFFAQGENVSIYILELGYGSVNTGVAALQTWINNNLYQVYGFLIPREWDSNASFLSLVALFENATALLYFWVTTTISTYTNYTPQMKSVILQVEAPGVVAGNSEFSLASGLWQVLSQNPSSTNKVPPFAFSFLYGVTPYPQTGNQSLFVLLKAAGVNWVDTGAEGGISTAIWKWGTTEDGNPLNYWYAIDWLQINANLQISNAVINGSNNPQNPLYLNQQGINSIQAVGASVLASAVTFGLLLGTVVQSELDGPSYATALATGTFAGQAVINAVPFASYYAASPNDYATGTYNGLACTVTPLRGFTSITFYINVTNIVAL